MPIPSSLRIRLLSWLPANRRDRSELGTSLQGSAISHSINVSEPPSKLEAQIQTGQRHFGFEESIVVISGTPEVSQNRRRRTDTMLGTLRRPQQFDYMMRCYRKVEDRSNSATALAAMKHHSNLQMKKIPRRVTCDLNPTPG
jgi:hypothetical protein